MKISPKIEFIKYKQTIINYALSFYIGFETDTWVYQGTPKLVTQYMYRYVNNWWGCIYNSLNINGLNEMH